MLIFWRGLILPLFLPVHFVLVLFLRSGDSMIKSSCWTVEEVQRKIGLSNWPKFESFMRGQQVRLDKRGNHLYYPEDVVRFLRDNKLL